MYLASDSRISWPTGRGHNLTWDYSRKVFASSRQADALGYCGDVLFTAQVLSQIIDLIDVECLFETNATPEQRFSAVSKVIRQSHSTYPPSQQHEFSVVHCSRHKEKMTGRFELFQLSWSQARGWESLQYDIPQQSDLVVTLGSGGASVRASFEEWKALHGEGTSRMVFGSFCETLQRNGDSKSGGAPQLVGLYREMAAETFGIIYNGKRFVDGILVDESPWLGGIEWRNEMFERCDWRTGLRLEGAQRHARPRGPRGKDP